MEITTNEEYYAGVARMFFQIKCLKRQVKFPNDYGRINLFYSRFLYLRDFNFNRYSILHDLPYTDDKDAHHFAGIAKHMHHGDNNDT